MRAYKRENLLDLRNKHNLSKKDAEDFMGSVYEDFLDLEENKAFKFERIESNKLKKLYYRKIS